VHPGRRDVRIIDVMLESLARSDAGASWMQDGARRHQWPLRQQGQEKRPKADWEEAMGAELRALFVLAALGLSLGGCASSAESTAPPSELTDASLLQQEGQGSDAWVYRASEVDLKHYTSFLVDPVTLYQGPEASFADLSEAHLAEITQHLASETSRALGDRYKIATQPGSGTARVKMTLVNVEPTVGGVATASRIIPIGAATNLFSGATGGSGSFTGSITVATEVFDAGTGKLVAAAVRRYRPDVFDMRATLSTMNTARAAVHEVAQSHRDAVDRVQAEQ
jgi:hypothetical protein